MDKQEIFQYNYSMQTCYRERIDFLKCIQSNITKQNTREKKEKKCKEFFDKYISCMTIYDNFINYRN